MKLLFVHGTKLKQDTNGQYYTGGSYNKDVWDRYLAISNNLSVVARKESNIYDTEYANNNFNYFDIGKIKFVEITNLTSSFSSFFSIKNRYNIKEIIKRAVLEHDYIIARVPSNSSNLAIKYSMKYNKPYLVEVVGCPWDSLWNHSIRGKALALPSMLNMKNSIKNAPYAIYVTNEFLQRRYPCIGKNIGCSDVSLPSIDDSIIEKRLDKIEQVSKDKPIILGTTAAVNVRYKGQKYVIESISKLNKEGYNFEYHLAGGGDNGYLKSIAERFGVVDKVKFLGSTPHEKVFEYLDNIDIYIQPSKTEGLPRALIEAMSRGCPCIGTDAGGIPELIESDCIFSIKQYNKLSIILLENSLNRIWLKEKAVRNFNEAKKYDRETIENKRRKFLEKFSNIGVNTNK